MDHRGLARADDPITGTGRIVRITVKIVVAVLLLMPVAGEAQQDPEVVFAVVTKVQKDRRQVLAQVSTGSQATEMSLIPSEALLENPSWKKLEICHSLKAEGWKQPEGYRIVSMKLLDAGMLPMTLQGLAGDCLLKKALEFAPQID
jgi:hypothetical protein